MRMRCMTVSCEETGAGDRCLKDLGLPGTLDPEESRGRRASASTRKTNSDERQRIAANALSLPATLLAQTCV